MSVLALSIHLAGLLALACRNGLAIRSDPDLHREMDRLVGALEASMHGDTARR